MRSDILKYTESNHSYDDEVKNNKFEELTELPDTKPLIVTDTSGNILYCNNSFSRIFGLNIGDRIEDIRSEPNLGAVSKNLESSNYRNFQFDLLHQPDPELEPVNYLVDSDRLLINNIEHILFTFDSYSVKKIIEGRINNLHNALEYGNVAVLITDDKGSINYSSKAFEDILNTGIEKIFGGNIADILLPYLSNNDLNELRDAIEFKKEWVKLISDLGKDGNIWFREVKLNPVYRNNSDSVSYILVANDITNYVLKNKVIQNSEQRQKSIINNISDPLIIINKKHEVLYLERVNDNFCTAFNFDKKDNQELEVAKVLKGDLLNTLADVIAKADKEKKQNIKFHFSDIQNQKEYTGKLTTTEDTYENSILYIINFSDITEQLRNEERLREAYEKEIRLNKLKSAFLANMSHEIRTPLNAIIGYAELLKDDVQLEEYDSIVENSDFLKEGVKRLLVLVENIIEASLIESGELELDLSNTDVNSILRELYQNEKFKHKQQKIEFDSDISEAELKCSVDKDKLEKIIVMIIDNAVKYNRENGIVFLRTFAENDTAVIKISDTGIGIETDKLKTILEPFAQEEEEGYKRKYEGAGLGLTLAYKLTMEMNGEFNITSQLGEGTEVTLRFPLI